MVNANLQFRIFDNVKKQMFYQDIDNYIQFYMEDKFSLFRYGQKDDELLCSNLFDDKDAVIMQGVGWKDKYTKDIYFGDIVKYIANFNNLNKDFNCEQGSAIVTTHPLTKRPILRRSFELDENNEPKTFYLENIKFLSTYASFDGQSCDFCNHKIYDVEVVGNIFENKYFINQ
jgi:hypothetical protein